MKALFIKILLWFGAFLFFFSFKLLWLLGFGTLLYFSYSLLKRLNNHFLAVYLKKIYSSFLTILYIIITLIGIKLFIMEIYYIPSNSMENTLIKSDIIIVNKLIYGPIIPQFFNFKWSTLKTEIENKAYYRLPGHSKIKHGDIIVYIDPTRGFFVVKRCVGLAGDTLFLKNKAIFINPKTFCFCKYY